VVFSASDALIDRLHGFAGIRRKSIVQGFFCLRQKTLHLNNSKML